MGAPAGHPYAHPEGVCINGLGALPSPYGPTLRGAHNGPSGLQKKKIICVCVWAHGGTYQPSNLGQNLCELGVNVRLCACMPALTPQKNLAKIKSCQNYVVVTLTGNYSWAKCTILDSLVV